MDLKKLLPKLLRNDFWEDFVDSISQELTNVKTEIDKKLNYWNVENLTDDEDLLEITNVLGYTPDLSLDDSITKLKREVYSIIYRIKNKTNYESFYFTFKDIPYLGNVYNLFSDNVRLIRSIDMSTTISLLDVQAFNEPFISFEPDFHYWSFTTESNSFNLDESPLNVLDSDPIISLDQNVIRLSTTHLAIEYAIDRIITESGIEYLMTPTYLDYLKNASNYSRKAMVVPHIGAQLSFLVHTTGFYDTDDTENSGYSIPDIKVKCSTTPFYSNESIFTKIAVGNGSKSLHSEDFPDINTDLLAYYAFDEEDDFSTNIYDDVTEANVSTIAGSFTRDEGIIGRAINFNGIDTSIEVESFVITNSDKSYYMWINGSDALQISTELRLLFQVNFIDLYIEDGFLKLSLGDSTTPFITLSTAFTLDGEDHFISFEIDKINDLGKLYIDNILKTSVDISGLGSIANTQNFYIGSKNNVYFFKGLIDEVRVYDDIKTTSEKTELYTNKIGSLRKIASIFYKNDLSSGELYSVTDWSIIQTCVESNMAKQEKMNEGDGITEIFSGTLKNPPLVEKLLTITYTSDGVGFTLTDDGKGILSGSSALGTINYTTGLYSILFYRDIDIEDEVISAVSVTTIVDQSLDHITISPTTFIMSYWFGAINYSVTDDGAGNITGIGITTATINYVTGKLDVTFDSSTDADKSITCNYTYEANSTPDNLSDILAKYRSTTNLNPTEVGIYDENDNMVAYATFPPIKFSDYNNQIAFQFCINKT